MTELCLNLFMLKKWHKLRGDKLDYGKLDFHCQDVRWKDQGMYLCEWKHPVCIYRAQWSSKSNSNDRINSDHCHNWCKNRNEMWW
jgi:hypothetical protein